MCRTLALLFLAGGLLSCTAPEHHYDDVEFVVRDGEVSGDRLAFGADFDSEAGEAPRPVIDPEEVLAVLEEQRAAWNRGDLNAFLATYLEEDYLTFSSGGDTTRGWEQIRDRYMRRYGSTDDGVDKMGVLAFDRLEVVPLGPDAALVIGQWQLETATGRPGGVFSLVLERFPEGWKIIHDHTSARPETEGAASEATRTTN